MTPEQEIDPGIDPEIPALADTTTLRDPSTARGARTRAALVAAARRIFERDGYLGSRLTDITAEAKVSTGTFYTYFDSKDEVLRAVVEEAQEDMLHPGLPRLDPDQASARDVIGASNRAYFEAYRRNARLMPILDQVAASDPRFREVRQRRTEAFTRRNARAIADLQAQGQADPGLDPELAALGLSAMVSRMAAAKFVYGDDHDVEPLVETATRLWANALKLPAEAPAAGNEPEHP